MRLIPDWAIGESMSRTLSPSNVDFCQNKNVRLAVMMLSCKSTAGLWIIKAETAFRVSYRLSG